MSPGKGDPLAALVCIDRLEVGAPRIEERRVRIPYRVVRGKERDETELVFRYEEPVFDRESGAARALGAMLGAHVALNYGLFCREIVFEGPLDAVDRAFIARYMEHTAREIYVNKFLRPNPFLTGAAAELPALRRKTYSRARLVFEGSAERIAGTGVQVAADPSSSRTLVLSSGGKDSLLTQGLLAEMSADIHPVFVNESGKHWFTALNAYRHFAAHVPHTARVWTNCDRVFVWMLRHLPFVRDDFARVRADIYPIRLWTVAIFVFAALPLARKRGCGRIVVGNEYDTTLRLSHKGITHYGGLFDQSRWFDAACSRYFRQKDLGVSLFSILRPLSELLIEKVLVERYPELQRLQMSCHAAHAEGGVVKPCGRCEKCRRIVGMLSALGADPRACGYDDTQIASVLLSLPREDLHQESEGAEHMLALLADRGLVPESAGRARHPEVLRLRYDTERSPVDAIPRDLREPLARVLLQHADGAVERKGRAWVPIDPLDARLLATPYAFEGPLRTGATAPSADSARFRWGELTWPRVESRLRETDIALLPVGAIEQHGPHLPLDTDSFDARLLCEQVALACASPRPLVLPLIAYGVSYHHEDFPGTISVDPDTLARLVHQIGLGAARNGISKLVIVNGHGGNGPSLHFAAQMINRDARIFVCVDTGETSDQAVGEITETPNDVHAGEVETSTALHLRPELVEMDRAVAHVPNFSSAYLDFTSSQSVGWYARTVRLSPSGVLGDPTKASAEKGKRMWEFIVRHLVALVEDLKGMSLDEIHQRRY